MIDDVDDDWSVSPCEAIYPTKVYNARGNCLLEVSFDQQ